METQDAGEERTHPQAEARTPAENASTLGNHTAKATGTLRAGGVTNAPATPATPATGSPGTALYYAGAAPPREPW